MEEKYVRNEVLMQIESIKLTEKEIENVGEAQSADSFGGLLSREQNEGMDGVSEIIQNSEINIANDDNPHNDDDNNINRFYEDAKKYWSKVPATVDGMLGGFGDISSIDLKGSHAFLNALFKMKPPPNKRYALDCGAGIGRITKGLLLPVFEKVDIVEQDSIFSEKAKEYIGANDRIGEIYNVDLQEFIPEVQKYDVVWCQWVLGHLTDDDLVKFFQRIKISLRRHGVLVIKENVTSSNCLEVDDNDSSMTRPLKTFQDLIKSVNLRIIKSSKQTNFPKGLYPVYIIACRIK